MKEKVTAIIQARATSERLRGKVFADLSGKSVLEHVFLSLKNCPEVSEIYVATTTNKEDDKIVELAQKYNIPYIRGSEDDVLSRFDEVSKITDSDVFVRITADDPLLDPEVTGKVIKEFTSGDYDYVSNIIERSWPRGMDTEVFSREALERSVEESDLDEYKEHVTLYIRANGEKFKIKNVSSSPEENMPELRLCVDTEDDYKLIKIIFDNLYEEGKIIHVGEVLNFLRDNPKYMEINKHIEQKKTLGKVY